MREESDVRSEKGSDVGPATAALRAGAGFALMAALLVGLHTAVSDPTQGAKLRVAVRTTAGTGQACRRLSDDEKAALPMHMRRDEVCETHAVPYRLEVRRNGDALLDRVYEASGVHGDRPLTITEDVVVAAGTHALAVRLSPVDTAAEAPSFTYSGDVQFPEGRIRVAVLEPKSTAFEIR